MRDIWAKCADVPRGYIFQGLADVYCTHLFQALATVAHLEAFRLKAFNEGYQAGLADGYVEGTTDAVDDYRWCDLE